VPKADETRGGIWAYQVRTWDRQLVSNSNAGLRYIAVTLPWVSILGQDLGPFRYELASDLPSSQYRGKVCPKHKALGGRRYRSNAHCVGCHKDRLRQKRSTPGHPVRESNLRAQRAAHRRLRQKRKAAQTTSKARAPAH
jgi:hypothetical protein